jgi:osmotically inducible protein OsmC
MVAVRTAEAHWEGSLFEGQGEVELVSSGLGHFEVTWATRAEEPNHHTSPEELIAAAHSACFTHMALSNVPAQGGTRPLRSTREPMSPLSILRTSPASG